MKISLFLILISAISLHAEVIYSQNMTIDMQNVTVREVINEIEKEGRISFLFNDNHLELNKKVSVSHVDSPIRDILFSALDQADMMFEEVGENFLVLIPKPAALQQQGITVTGRVTDASTGDPLPGATIVIQGTAIGTVTDLDGYYSINVPDTDVVLVFSYVGYMPVTTIVDERREINVELGADITELGELVVIGYGTQVRRDITGAVTMISGEDLSKRGTTNLSTALQGAVAGVTASRSSSAPGSSSSLLIRGITTLEGSTSPLILVDDIPYRSLDDVNPADVESITFLKDASAASIYGSRAAAGVIIITTKRAKDGVFSANYNLDYIVNTPTRVPQFVGTKRYMEMTNELNWNDGAGNQFNTYSEDYINNYFANHASDPDQFPNTDWSRLIIKDNSNTIRHNINITGGTGKLRTSANFGYETQDALYEGYDYRRITGRMNNDIEITRYFGANLDVALNLIDVDRPHTDPTYEALRTPGVYSAVHQSGDISGGKTGDNIYAIFKYGGTTQTATNRLYSKLGFYLKPLDGLKISANIAPMYNFQHNKTFTKKVPYWGANDPDRLEPPLYIGGHLTNNLTESRGDAFNLTGNALANYTYSGNDHNFSALAGYEEYYSKDETLGLRAIEFESADYPFLSQAPSGNIFNNGTGISESSYRSVFGKASYNYQNKYYIQANVRADGSSKFHPDYRWGIFPSVSAGWVLSSENFMESLSKTIPFLKLRASHGSLGNDRLGNYLYLAAIGFSNVLISQGQTSQSMNTAALWRLVIEDITWETTTTTNIGMDVNFFDNKLAINADYFIKETTDMLLDLNIPGLIGFDDPRYNVGDMNTKGWELTTTWQHRIGELGYSASFNIYDSKSIVGNINDKEIFSGNTVTREGLEYRTWYGYLSDGIFQTAEEVANSAVTSNAVRPGDIKYKDISGPDGEPDKIINALDRTELGGSMPRYQFGGAFNFNYKGFDLGFIFQGVGKLTAHLNSGVWRPFERTWLSTPKPYDGNYWSLYNTEEENLNAKYPRLSLRSDNNNAAFSDYNLIDGSYFRLKNLTFGYTLPENIIQKVSLTNVRLYITANDIFTIDNYPRGWDPEYGGGYLITKSLNFGLQVKL